MSRREPAARIDELSDGQMKQLKIEGHRIVLARINGEFHALGGVCPHYGAPLAQGTLHGGRLICPWHHAFFKADTGELLEPPAMDGIPRFDVEIEGDQIYVVLPDEIPRAKIPSMTGPDRGRDRRTFVIVGAGAAGNAAAQALRERGFPGRIVMITGENRPPYDRPKLSKTYLQGEATREQLPLRSDDFYKKHGIELMLGKRAVGLDRKNRRVDLEDGAVAYDSLLLATGGSPRTLGVPGADLGNVFTLRSWDDCEKIIAAARAGARAVVVGSSFIGMETASSLSDRKVGVTVVAPERVPFERVFGSRIGEMFVKLHESIGTAFKLGASVAEFRGKGAVSEAVLDSGETLEADLVIVGVGVRPATAWLDGLELEPDGSLKVDDRLHVADDIYAAGDIATFPYWYNKHSARIEHWRTAEQLGRVAGANMAGENMTFDSLPFFWTRQAGLSLAYVGHADQWDDVIIDGDVNSGKFMAYFVAGNRILAAAACGRSADMGAAHALMLEDRLPKASEIRSAELTKLLA